LKEKISYLDGELKNTEAEHEKEIKVSREQADKLQVDLKRQETDHENQIETINNVHAAVVKQFEEEILGHKDSYQSLMADIDTLKNEKEKLIQDLEAKNKQKKDLEKNIVQSEQKKNEEVAAQKQKYETKVKTLKETIETKYRKKVEQAMEKWKTDKVALENQCKDVIAKEKENLQRKKIMKSVD
jgi:chromosome segregation ATPase